MPSDSRERAYWLTSVGDDKFLGQETRASATRRLKTLLKMGWYLFAENTPGRKRMKSGDLLCFYLKRTGVIAVAELGEPQNFAPAELRDFIRARFNCPIRIRNSREFFEQPVVLDLDLRSKLDAFKNRNPAHWQWFVQMTHNLSEHDFSLITAANSVKPD